MSPETPVYGGWRERRGFGIATMSGAQTFGALAAVGCLLIAAMIHPGLVVFLAPPVVLLALVFLGRVRGEALPSLLARHLGWFWGERRGSHVQVNGVQLPGELGRLTVMEVADANNSVVAVIHDPGAQTITALVPLEPAGLEFVDDDEVCDQVQAWGDWLAQLGYVQDLSHVVVTVVSGLPDHGGALRSRTVLSVSLRDARGLEQTCADLMDVVASTHALSRCGVSVAPAMSLEQLSRWVRDCFDPAPVGEGVAVHWEDARPVAVREHWDRYVHDGSVSTGFFWDECPSRAVHPQVLLRLLGPSTYRKRVSLVYEPVPAHQAAREVDRQAQAAVFRRQYHRRLGRDETAREQADLERARQTAREQAAGAGLVDVGVYAVLSAAQGSDLDGLVADMHNRAGESRIRFRRSYGTQATTFMTTLGLGMVPKAVR